LKIQHQITEVIINKADLFIQKWNSLRKCKHDRNWCIPC